MAFIELGTQGTGEYESLIRSAGDKMKVSPELISAHIMAESSFNPRAYNPEGSYGLMQIYSATAKKLLNKPDLKLDLLFDPTLNITAGARIIKDNLSRYAGNVSDAIAAYNAGVARKNFYGKYIDSKGSTRVQDYVDRVLGYYNIYKGGHSLSAIGVPGKAILSIPILILSALAVLFLTMGETFVGERRSYG